MRCVLNLLLRTWSRRKRFLDGRKQDLQKMIMRRRYAILPQFHPRPPFFKKKSRCEFWAGTMGSYRPMIRKTVGHRCRRECAKDHCCGITCWMAHLLPGSCTASIFCKFPSLAHNLIHTGYYGTEMQGYWCYRDSLLEWSAVWLIHAS